MAMIPGFPTGVDPMALEGGSYNQLGQAGEMFASAFSTVAGLGGASTSLAPGAAPGGVDGVQALMAQAFMNNLKFLDQVWMQLLSAGLVSPPAPGQGTGQADQAARQPAP